MATIVIIIVISVPYTTTVYEYTAIHFFGDNIICTSNIEIFEKNNLMTQDCKPIINRMAEII